MYVKRLVAGQTREDEFPCEDYADDLQGDSHSSAGRQV